MQSLTSGRTLERLGREGRLTVALALPLAAGQISQIFISLADTLMVGRLGVVPLAAATFANNVLYVPFIVGLGFSTAISVRVSQARGSGDREAARAALRHGLYLALAARGAYHAGQVWVFSLSSDFFTRIPKSSELFRVTSCSSPRR